MSDHVGRRTVLLMSLVGTAVGYILLGMSNSIVLMALARVPSGIYLICFFSVHFILCEHDVLRGTVGQVAINIVCYTVMLIATNRQLPQKTSKKIKFR